MADEWIKQRKDGAVTDWKSVSLGAEIEPHDRWFGEVSGDHPGAPGGGAVVTSYAKFDVSFILKKQKKLVEILLGGLTCKDDEDCGYNPPHLEHLMV